MKKINDEELHRIIHGIGVMALAGSLMDTSNAQAKKSQQLITMAAIVIVMHNGHNVINDMIENEADVLHEVLQELTAEEGLE